LRTCLPLLALPIRLAGKVGVACLLLAAIAEEEQSYNKDNKRYNQCRRCDNKWVFVEGCRCVPKNGCKSEKFSHVVHLS